jgi:hypothetical protein
LRGLSKCEYGFVHFEIPYYDLAILASTSKDVRHHSVPADRSNSRTLMVVRHARFKQTWLLDVVLNILNEDLRPSTCEQIFLDWIEFNGCNRHAVVDVCR